MEKFIGDPGGGVQLQKKSFYIKAQSLRKNFYTLQHESRLKLVLIKSGLRYNSYNSFSTLGCFIPCLASRLQIPSHGLDCHMI